MSDQNESSVSFRRVNLDFPFMRGDEKIEQIGLRKPASGELRGLSMNGLMNSDYTTLETLLPRITVPPVSKAEIGALDPADFVQLAAEVMDFLLPRAAKPASLPA